MSISKGFSKVGKMVSKNSPLLLSILGAASVASTAILAAKASPKAKERIATYEKLAEAEREVGNEEAAKQLKRNLYFDIAKIYAPAAVSGIAGVACIIGAHKIHTNRQIALAATCALTEKKFEDYQKEAQALLGEKEEAKIREKVAENTEKTDRFKNAPIIQSPGGGEVLFFDDISGRKFYSTHEKVDAAINQINAMRLSHPDDEIELNEFYDNLDIDDTGAGSILGWKPYDKMSQTVKIKKDYTSTEDQYGRELPCCMISFPVIDLIGYGNNDKFNKHVY